MTGIFRQCKSRRITLATLNATLVSKYDSSSRFQVSPMTMTYNSILEVLTKNEQEGSATVVTEEGTFDETLHLRTMSYQVVADQREVLHFMRYTHHDRTLCRV